MEYCLYKFASNKYRVGLVEEYSEAKTKYLTDRYLTRKDAIKQLYAVSLQENGVKPEIIIKKM